MSCLDFVFNVKLVLLALRDHKKSQKSPSLQTSETDIYNHKIIVVERRNLISLLVGVTLLDITAILLISMTRNLNIIHFGSMIYSMHVTLSLCLLQMLFLSMKRIRVRMVSKNIQTQSGKLDSFQKSREGYNPNSTTLSVHEEEGRKFKKGTNLDFLDSDSNMGLSLKYSTGSLDLEYSNVTYDIGNEL